MIRSGREFRSISATSPLDAHMIGLFPALALLLGWATHAHAFPPCPSAPLELEPLDNAPAPLRGHAWYRSGFTVLGDTSVLHLVAPPQIIFAGKCRPSGQPPAVISDTGLMNRLSSGAINLEPRYAPSGAFGVIFLPYLPSFTTNQLNVAYTVSFTVDNSPLADTGDWFDVAQLDFSSLNAANQTLKKTRSSIYRIRKIQRNNGLATLAVIESRMRATDTALGAQPHDTVVAVIPLVNSPEPTRIALRWTQLAKIGLDDEQVDSVVQVIGPDDSVLYTATLTDEWANTLSMGLLDYNTANGADYSFGTALKLEMMQLSAKEL